MTQENRNFVTDKVKAILEAPSCCAELKEIGMEWLGKYYGHEDLGKLVGGISALFAFTVIVLMESISIAENFAAANPKSPLAKVLANHLQKVGKQIEESEKEDKT